MLNMLNMLPLPEPWEPAASRGAGRAKINEPFIARVVNYKHTSGRYEAGAGGKKRLGAGDIRGLYGMSRDDVMVYVIW